MAMKKGRELKWTWRKPKGKPKRNLSAYNMFMADVRPQVMAERARSAAAEKQQAQAAAAVAAAQSPNVSQLADAAAVLEGDDSQQMSFLQTVQEQWKNLDPSVKDMYQQRAARDKERYKMELAEWEAAEEQQQQEKQQQQLPYVARSSSSGHAVIQAKSLALAPLAPHISSSDSIVAARGAAASSSGQSPRSSPTAAAVTDTNDDSSTFCRRPPDFMYDALPPSLNQANRHLHIGIVAPASAGVVHERNMTDNDWSSQSPSSLPSSFLLAAPLHNTSGSAENRRTQSDHSTLHHDDATRLVEPSTRRLSLSSLPWPSSYQLEGDDPLPFHHDQLHSLHTLDPLWSQQQNYHSGHTNVGNDTRTPHNQAVMMRINAESSFSTLETTATGASALAIAATTATSSSTDPTFWSFSDDPLLLRHNNNPSFDHDENGEDHHDGESIVSTIDESFFQNESFAADDPNNGVP